MRRLIEGREQARVDIELDRLRSAGSQVDLLERHEPPRSFPSGRRGIDLPDGHSAALAGVAQGEADANSAVGSSTRADRAVAEAGVRKTVAEREQRLGVV